MQTDNNRTAEQGQQGVNQKKEIYPSANIPSWEEIRDALYERHGKEQQDKLFAARVAVAGLGGLGSHAAMALARCGVGHLHLIDFDRVELTNLNRQQYGLAQLGRYKTEALREQILAVNPYLDVRIDTLEVTPENIRTLFAEDEIICEAFDRPENKAMLVNGICEAFPQKFLVCASGMAGFGESNRIRTRQLTKRWYLCGDEETEAAAGRGLMAPRVELCAAHEANLIIELILRLPGTRHE